MKKFMLAVLLASLFVLSFAVIASAQAPEPYFSGMRQCSSLTVAELTTAKARFDAAYWTGYSFVSDGMWQSSYKARANDFASIWSCPHPYRNVWDDNFDLTYYYQWFNPLYQ